MDYVAVDLGYGYVKAMSSAGKRVLFPALVGKGYERSITDFFDKTSNDLENMHVVFKDESYFVGDLAKESRSVSRIFERERFNHSYTHVLLNTAIQLVTNANTDKIYLSTGLPLDFYKSQAKAFQTSLVGSHESLEWKAGPLANKNRKVLISQALVFPQGASAVFSALINHEGKFNYPHLMGEGTLIGLIDIGFRTTDFVVVEMKNGGAFKPIAKLSGTVDEGVVNLHRDIRQAFKTKSGGADLNEFHISRILKDGFITFKGKKMNFDDVTVASKQAIVTNIIDRLNGVWAEESDLFDAIFIAGGGGLLFSPYLQPHFDDRLININESQFANTIGYLRLGKAIFEQQNNR